MTKRVTLFVPLTLPPARTLDLPLELEQAADNIIAGHTVQIDVASVNDHPFFNVASLGFSAELARGLSLETKRRWGRPSYAPTRSRPEQ